MRSKKTIFNKYRVFLLFGGRLCWWGSYKTFFNAKRCLEQSGTGYRVLLTYSEDGGYGFLTGVMVKEEDVIREATPMEKALIQCLPVQYERIVMT